MFETKLLITEVGKSKRSQDNKVTHLCTEGGKNKSLRDLFTPVQRWLVNV